MKNKKRRKLAKLFVKAVRQGDREKAKEIEDLTFNLVKRYASNAKVKVFMKWNYLVNIMQLVIKTKDNANGKNNK